MESRSRRTFSSKLETSFKFAKSPHTRIFQTVEGGCDSYGPIHRHLTPRLPLNAVDGAYYTFVCFANLQNPYKILYYIRYSQSKIYTEARFANKNLPHLRYCPLDTIPFNLETVYYGIPATVVACVIGDDGLLRQPSRGLRLYGRRFDGLCLVSDRRRTRPSRSGTRSEKSRQICTFRLP